VYCCHEERHRADDHRVAAGRRVRCARPVPAGHHPPPAAKPFAEVHGPDARDLHRPADPGRRHPRADVADCAAITSCGLAGTDLEAPESLLTTETGIMIDDDGPRDQQVYEGRHRITAMRGGGVQRTVLIRLELVAVGDPP
jgi:hypothetical protein